MGESCYLEAVGGDRRRPFWCLFVSVPHLHSKLVELLTVFCCTHFDFQLRSQRVVTISEKKKGLEWQRRAYVTAWVPA